MSAFVAPFPVFKATDANGVPLAGGLLYTYEAGTLTPLASYTDQSGGTPNANPVVLDSTGSANVWLSQAAYKFVLTDADGVQQWSVDNINAQPPQIINVLDYGALGDGSTDDTAAFAAAAAAAGSWGTVLVPRPSVSYKLDSNPAGSQFWIFMGSATTSGSGVLSGLTIQQVSGGSINIGGNTVEITDDGKVGLGTNAPVEALDIVGNLNFPDVSGSPSGKAIWNSGGVNSSIDYGVSNTDVFTITDGLTASSFTYGNGVLTLPATGNLAAGTQTLGSSKGLFLSEDNLSIGYNKGANGQILIANSNFGVTALTLQCPTSPYNDFSFVQIDSGGSSTSNSGYIMHNFMGGGFNGGGPAYPMIAILGTSKVTIGGNTGASLNTSVTPGVLTEIFGNSSIQDPIRCLDLASGSSSATLMGFYRGNFSTKVGSITTTNSATAFNTSSDYRLKEDLRLVTGSLEKVNALKVYNFKWKDSEDRNDGFMAHHAATIAPYAVQGEKNGEQMQQLDYSKLVPLLWAAVQELSTKVKELESR